MQRRDYLVGGVVGVAIVAISTFHRICFRRFRCLLRCHLCLSLSFSLRGWSINYYLCASIIQLIYKGQKVKESVVFGCLKLWRVAYSTSTCNILGYLKRSNASLTPNLDSQIYTPGCHHFLFLFLFFIFIFIFLFFFCFHSIS